MSTLRVDLNDLKSGVRYYFRLNKYPVDRFEGTFDRVIQIPGMNEQYIFKNIFVYNSTGILIYKLESANYGNSLTYPQDIFVYTSNKLPGDLNSYINKFGGKSRKTKRRYNKRKTFRKSSNKKRKN